MDSREGNTATTLNRAPQFEPTVNSKFTKISKKQKSKRALIDYYT